MNKYQEALNSIKEKTTEIDEYETIPKSAFCHCTDEIDTLKELVDKATHKEVKCIEVGDYGGGVMNVYVCPTRGNKHKYLMNYCCDCGQALYWSKEGVKNDNI